MESLWKTLWDFNRVSSIAKVPPERRVITTSCSLTFPHALKVCCQTKRS